MDEIADTIGARMRFARERMGMTQQVAADEMGISKAAISQWERNQTKPATDNILEAARVYGCPATWLIEGVGGPLSEQVSEKVSQTISTTVGRLPPRQVLPPPNASKPVAIQPDSSQKMPVLGLGRGGADGRFQFNGQEVEYVPRPAELEDVPGAYGIYVDGDSMRPRFKEGELLLVHPGRKPRREDDVVVQLYPDREEDPPEGYIKEFRAWTPKKLILWQWNPAEEFEVDRPLVKSVHVIVGTRR